MAKVKTEKTVLAKWGVLVVQLMLASLLIANDTVQ